MKKFMFIILLLPNICFGEVILHIASYHPNNTYLNNNTLGIAYEKDAILLGTYYNSYERMSYYVAKEKYLLKNISVLYGVVTGYPIGTLPLVTFNMHNGNNILSITRGTDSFCLTWSIKL